MSQKELVSPCGLYCGVCGMYLATLKDDHKLREKLSAVYGIPADMINCRGCLSDTVFPYCRECAIKRCASEKQIEGCYACDAFPCEHVDAFPVPEGKKNILRAVPEWKKLGTEKWIQSEIKMFSCPECGALMFRGGKKCRGCGAVKI